MTKPIVVVGCGFPQMGLLRAAKALGLETVGLDADPSAIAVGLASRFVRASTGDPAAVAAAARAVDAAAITSTGSELALTTTASVAAELALPFYADPETVRRCQLKDVMRAGYARAGLRTPRFAACMSVAEARAFVAKVGYPVVVKPAHGWGQRGVSRVDDEASLAVLVEAAAAASHGGGGAVIEECLCGRELSVNAWVERGELRAFAVTDREVFAGARPLGVMRSEVSPPSISEAEAAGAVEAAARGAAALGLVRGPCYSQVCLTQAGPVLFETAARCGGGFDADVTRLVSGVDLYRRVLGVAIGDEALEREGASGPTHPAALVRFLPPPRGFVREVRGVDEARRATGVVDAAVYARPGARLTGLTHAPSRVGHLLCVGRTRDEAVARADHASSLIEIAVDPG